MSAEPHALDYSPQLPNELCREIIENLHYFKDRNTLLRFALVSKAWCAESQRVLFRTVCDDSIDPDKHKSLVHTHILFLKTIILNPTRLGPYVQTYHQRELMCHPFFRADSVELLVADASSLPYLWDLTARALRAFVNLKHLFIKPQHDGRRTPRAYLLKGCTFKLKSLKWGFAPYDSTGTDPFIHFLRTQHSLELFEDGREPERQDFSWLTDDICPNLTSTACQLGSSVHVMAKRKNIVGLKTWSDWNRWKTVPQVHLSGLHRLKYLSISADHDLMSYWETTEVISKIILLELASWNLRTIETIHGFSNLRVLVLLRNLQPPSRYYGRVLRDQEEEHEFRTQVAIESFHRCPNLEYVVIGDVHRGQEPMRYMKFSIAGLNRAPEYEQEIVTSEAFSIEHEPGMPWWSAYGVQ